jgi:hypothetical protein
MATSSVAQGLRPAHDLLAIFALSVGVYAAPGTLLTESTPLAWWQGYLVSASTGIVAGLFLARRWYERSRSRP